MTIEREAYYLTPPGSWLRLIERDGFLCGCDWVAPSSEILERRDDNISPLLKEVFHTLDKYFEGEVEILNHFPWLSIPAKSEFSHKVWRALLTHTVVGQAMTYGDLCKVMGLGRSWARAVAAGCGSNPLQLFVPCHRIVGADSIGGYRGGVAMKRYLLEWEAKRVINLD